MDKIAEIKFTCRKIGTMVDGLERTEQTHSTDKPTWQYVAKKTLSVVETHIRIASDRQSIEPEVTCLVWVFINQDTVLSLLCCLQFHIVEAEVEIVTAEPAAVVIMMYQEPVMFQAHITIKTIYVSRTSAPAAIQSVQKTLHLLDGALALSAVNAINFYFAEHVKRTTQGKLAAATQRQSAEYLKPLFKLLRARNLPPDMLARIAEIVHYMQKRQYQKANDSYLRLSIGNAPWPIGVTMVGIHERSAREKISADQVAHVLNDEVSRKYIQSLKRILTFAQTKYPPDDVTQLMG
ncbi:hypothetical protein NUW54_g269 [Trametes sanguinea]|uniref:Uncharacterized protein n=1 Tax=Trametes sanguinea TaxID=158606 RepID=A0ACC1QCN4_9APHY|nr:hypothetical protein NUW54_g269 [Trametes sanguinea]